MCETGSAAAARPAQPAESPMHNTITEIPDLIMNSRIYVKNSIETLYTPSRHGSLQYCRGASEKTLHAREVARDASCQTALSSTVVHTKSTPSKRVIPIVKRCRVNRREDVTIKAGMLVELASILSST